LNKHFDWDKTIDNIQFGMLWFIVAILVVCVSVLILFDILAGAGVMTYLTNENVVASVFISLATSGLLISLMVLVYSASSNTNKKTVSVGKMIGVIAFGVYCLDVYFDSMTADYLRFDQIMVLKDIPNYPVHLLFRILIGGISTVGEALAMSIILGMPILKEIINKAIPESMRTSGGQNDNGNNNNNNNQNNNRPQNNQGGNNNNPQRNNMPQQTSNLTARLPQQQSQRTQEFRPAPKPSEQREPTYHPMNEMTKMSSEEIARYERMRE
jgi:hypothetical protein